MLKSHTGDSQEKISSVNSNMKKAKLQKRGNFILRQEINSYTPSFNVRCGIITNLVFLIVAVGLGTPMIILANNTNEIRIEYTKCRKNNDDNTCKLSFTTKKLSEPLFLYYELNNFFMNHRKFVKSKIWAQLRGDDVSSKQTCDNAWTMEQMFGEESVYYTNEWGHTFNKTDIANPCGLIARAFFNDTYTLHNNDLDMNIPINETLISNSYLRKQFYKRNKNYKEKQWIDVENEHFINWMNVETFDNFRKLWGRITMDLPAGNYSITVNDNYNVDMYKAKKFIVITDANPLGQNNFLGWLLVAIGIYCSLVILVLWVIKLSNKEKIFQLNE